MSFSRDNYHYKSLPVNKSNASQLQRSNLAMNQLPQHQQTNMTNVKSQPVINTEEFAKLDALLEDLLAEVDQPILFSKEKSVGSNLTTISKSASLNHNANINNNINTKLGEIERSVDWLNEQKEILRSRKELNNSSNKYTINSYSTSKLSEPTILTYLSDDIQVANNQQNRKIKSKLDSYVSNSSAEKSSNMINKATISNSDLSNHQSKQTQQGFMYTNAENLSRSLNRNLDSNLSEHINYTTAMTNTSNKCVNTDPSPSVQVVNNKPPVSPNNRALYSPIQQQQQQLQQTGISASFRSLSTNPTLLKNINETDDELNQIDADFDRYSQKSYKSNASTIQRSKYHVVSNDFTECTRAAAPTPVPSSSYNRSNFQSKRALSAPPTEIGKVVLQRMELKSPLTVRQPSVVPFEQSQSLAYPISNHQMLQQRIQTPVNYTISNRSQIDNPYNNRGILKTNNLNTNQASFETTTTATTNQQVPTRSVFLNRSYSETPRMTYTNGYETDSGLFTNNGYVYRNSNQNGTNRVVDSDQEQFNATNGYRVGEAANYRYGNTGVINNTYRTLAPSTTTNARYQVINDQSGYDTDTGLIKLRQVLDNRRVPSQNSIPIQNTGYYYQNRSVTPSFNYHYNQLQEQQDQQSVRQVNQFNNSQSNMTQIPINDSRFGNQIVVGTYPSNVVEDVGVTFIDNENQFAQSTQHLNNIEFVDANGNITIGLPTYITSDGRQVILKEDLNQQPQSVIIQQQVAPSAYQSNGQTMFQTNGSTNAINMQHRDTPSRSGVTASATHLSLSSQKQQVQQQANFSSSQQQLSQEDSRRGSASSLNETNEVLRTHPKSIKATQCYWYKPKISRDEAITILKDKQPGTFLIRDSNNFPGAYGLALKVDKPPQNVQLKPGADPTNELVRHFLIEPTTKGVRIKGCCNEPVFGSLAALVYQHSITPLALPIKLILPAQDLGAKSNEQTMSKQTAKSTNNQIQDARHLLEKGAACNVYFLSTINVEHKNGIEAIGHALANTKAFTNKDSSQLLLVQFKVTSQGITLTDLNKRKFLRQHFPANTVVYCAVDDKVNWPQKMEKILKPRIFGVVCRPKVNSGTNECHLFVELDPEQPAIAIVDFINRYLIPSRTLK